MEGVEDILTYRYGITETEHTWARDVTEGERVKLVTDSLRPLAERDGMSHHFLEHSRLAYSLVQLILHIGDTGQLSPQFSCARPTLPELTAAHPDSLLTCTAKDTKDHGTLYVMQTTDATDSPWIIAVHDLLTVGQTLRQKWGPTSSIIAESLLKRGIPYTALWRDATHFIHTQRTPGIPPLYRPSTYIWNVEDYRGYSLCRRSYLQNTAIAGCAVRKGGILWRLAIESGVQLCDVAFDTSRRQVLDAHKVEIDGEVYIAEDLPTGISDMIVGLCKTYTGNKSIHHIL